MIFVSLGTFHSLFPRPLIAIESAVKSGKVNEEIIAQIGHTNFTTDAFKTTPFFSPDEIDKLYDDARIIVTHAGTGSILKGVKKRKKVIVIPRLHKYAEHIDDHQLDILNEFAKSHYILPWTDGESFETILSNADCFVPVPYTSSKDKLVSFLMNYIDSI